MNVVDSSGWLEYFADTPRRRYFLTAIEHPMELVIPVITIYEVYKKVLAERGEMIALRIVGQMLRGKVVDLDTKIALAAGAYSVELKLAMADSIVYATALTYSATLWTQDADFKGLPGVKYFKK